MDDGGGSTFEFPLCWNNDSRMTALFAPFRERALNPEDWDSKLTFWSDLIERWSKGNKRCCFTIEELSKAFLRNGRVPMCISSVVNELHRSGVSVTEEEFTEMTKYPVTWLGWAFDLAVKKPVSWTVRKVKETVSIQVSTQQNVYIHIPATKALGESILSSASSDMRGMLIDMGILLSNCGLSGMPAQDATFLAYWLQYQGHAAILDSKEDNGKPYCLVKLRNLGKNSKAVISDVDHGIHALQSNHEALTCHIEGLEKERQALLSEAKSYLSKGMRPMAKSCLRKKKEIENIIEKRAVVLENVHVLLARLRDATSDAQVIESYRLGTAALKRAYKDAGLSEDSVSDAVDDVRDVLDMHNEIQSTLSEPVDDNTDENLEEELAVLLSDENAPKSGGGGNLTDNQNNLLLTLQHLDVNKDDAVSPNRRGGSVDGFGLSDLPNVPCSPLRPNDSSSNPS